jgi:hypothetical protein
VRNIVEMKDTPTLGCRVYEPTPKDVRRVCGEIQATWSPRERAQRAMIRLSELVEAINAERADSPRHAGAAGDEAER